MNMDSGLIKRALCFHGKPMQKIWDDERGAGDLQIIGVPEDGNYNIYMERQKYFTFQDRAKRLKLHQFLARKSMDLFDKDLCRSQIQSQKSKEDIEKAKQFVAEVPPYELFIVKNQDKVKRHILESIKTGDIIYATIVRSKLPSTKLTIKLTVTPVCTAEPNCKLLHDYKLKAQIPPQLYELASMEKSTKSRGNDIFEYLRCEVIEISIDADRLTLSLLHTSTKNKNIKLGFIPYEDMPQLYRKMSEKSLEKYDECLRNAKEFENPNYEVLYNLNGLDINDNFSLMTNLKNDFPPQEYAKELRQVQASKWAFRSVAEGIEYFKIGQHVEAFQCLNKALNIDPRNVEGLVARGALYANKGSFLKAVEDFEKALKLNAYHVNARKYMGETLVALGRSYEEDNRIQEAAKAYRDCLNIIPNHEQARLSLDAIQYRTGATVEPIISSEISLAPTGSGESILHQQLNDFENQITTIQSSSNDESSGESSESETDGSDERLTKDPSLSPLSKKMVMHRACLETNQKAQMQYNQSLFQNTQKPVTNYTVIPNEFKLDDDDTESRVQKLLQKAMKHKKEKKKSKKSKKTKKAKKDIKTPKNTDSILNKINLEDAYNLLGSGLQIESTLNNNLKMYEQTIQEIRKRQEILKKSATTTEASTSAASYSQVQRKRSETPPPPPLKTNLQAPSTYVYKSLNFNKNNYTPTAKPTVQEQPKFSFQIKKPVKVDKFGLIRLATPALQNSPTPSPPRTKRFSRSPRSRQRSRSRNRARSTSRSRSRSRNRRYNGGRGRPRYRRRYQNSSSSSRSRSISKSRYRGRRHSSRGKSSGSRSGRRSPSPFVPRGTPSPNSRYRRSRSPRFNRRSPLNRRYSRSPKRKYSAPKFGNRTWQRPDFKPRVVPSSSDNKWLHDKFEDKNDGPSIEEIDEIISKAQKERKQDIINRDKNILKKN